MSRRGVFKDWARRFARKVGFVWLAAVTCALAPASFHRLVHWQVACLREPLLLLTERESCARAGIRRRYSAHQLPLKPYRDTTSSFVELRQLIDAQRWKDATRATRTALLASELSTSTIRELDAVWTAASMGRFGFSAQLRAAAHPLPPAGVWEDDCAYATRVGEAVGWRQATGWLRWRDVAWPSGVGPLLEIAGQASSFPEGCFPFHDAVTSDAWSTGFSPRDCWGTAAWTTWCRVWRSLDTGP